jgi:hypothetical protein
VLGRPALRGATTKSLVSCLLLLVLCRSFSLSMCHRARFCFLVGMLGAILRARLRLVGHSERTSCIALMCVYVCMCVCVFVCVLSFNDLHFAAAVYIQVTKGGDLLLAYAQSDCTTKPRLVFRLLVLKMLMKYALCFILQRPLIVDTRWCHWRCVLYVQVRFSSSVLLWPVSHIVRLGARRSIAVVAYLSMVSIRIDCEIGIGLETNTTCC